MTLPPTDELHRVLAAFDVHGIEACIGGSALRDGDAVDALPSRRTTTWNDLPIADPSVWATAYRLLGRLDRAALLDGGH